MLCVFFAITPRPLPPQCNLGSRINQSQTPWKANCGIMDISQTPPVLVRSINDYSTSHRLERHHGLGIVRFCPTWSRLGLSPGFAANNVSTLTL